MAAMEHEDALVTERGNFEVRMLEQVRQSPTLAAQMAAAGVTPEQYVKNIAALHERFARSMFNNGGREPVEYMRAVNRSQEIPGGVLEQPLNPGIDLETPVHVVVGREAFAGREVHELTKGNGRREVLGSVAPGVYRNDSTGWDLELNHAGIKHSVGAAASSGHGLAQIEAVKHLPELIKSAVLVESHPDMKGDSVQRIHRFFSPLQLGDKAYAVKIIVKEFEGKRIAEIEDVRRVYDASIAKELPASPRQLSPQGAEGTIGTSSGSPSETGPLLSIPLRRLLEGVKDSDKNVYLHPALSAAEALKRDSEAWGKSVDAFFDGSLHRTSPVVMLKQTPLVMHLVGARNLPIEVSHNTLEKILLPEGVGRGKHGLPAALLKQVPEAMADPVMMFRSESVGGDIVMMLDLKDQHGASLVVPVMLKKKKDTGYVVNVVKSIHAKNYAGTGKARDGWFVRQIKEGNLLYINQEKSRRWEHAAALALPPEAGAVDGGIPTNGKNKIYTQADLVKLRSGNPTMYQDGAPVPGARGSVSIADGSYFVRLFERADLSTLTHETGHIFLSEMRDVARSGAAWGPRQRERNLELPASSIARAKCVSNWPASFIWGRAFFLLVDLGTGRNRMPETGQLVIYGAPVGALGEIEW